MHTTVTVYSITPCVQCAATKRALDKQGIAYVEVDMTNDEAQREHMRQMGWQQAPIVEVRTEKGVETWAGYRPDLIKAL